MTGVPSPYAPSSGGAGTGRSKASQTAVRPASGRPWRQGPLSTDGRNPEQLVLNDFCKALEDHRKTCEATCKYAEAEVAMYRMSELKLVERQHQRHELRARHIQERVATEAAHQQDFASFSSEWDQRMMLFDAKAAELEEQMKQRHADHLMHWRNTMANSDMRPRFSAHLLNLRKVQSNLAKQRLYADAQAAKSRADRMEVTELNKLNMQHQSKVGAQEEKLIVKQTAELGALHKRVQAGRLEHNRQRKLDLERLLQRYANVKMALEKQQGREMMALTRKLKAIALPLGVTAEEAGVGMQTAKEAVWQPDGPAFDGQTSSLGERFPYTPPEPSSARPTCRPHSAAPASFRASAPTSATDRTRPTSAAPSHRHRVSSSRPRSSPAKSRACMLDLS